MDISSTKAVAGSGALQLEAEQKEPLTEEQAAAHQGESDVVLRAFSEQKVRGEAAVRAAYRGQTHIREMGGRERRWEVICKAYYGIFNKAERGMALSPPSKQGRVIIGEVTNPDTANLITHLIFCPGNDCNPAQAIDETNGNEMIRLNSITVIREKDKGITGTDGQITIEFRPGGHRDGNMDKVIIQPIINSDTDKSRKDEPVTEAEGGWSSVNEMFDKVAKLAKEKSPIYAQEGDSGRTRLRVRDKIIEAALHHDSLGVRLGAMGLGHGLGRVGLRPAQPGIRLVRTQAREYSGPGAEGTTFDHPVYLDQYSSQGGGGKGGSKTKRRKYNKTRTRKRKSKSKKRKRRKKSKRR